MDVFTLGRRELVMVKNFDYRALITQAPDLYLVLDAELDIIEASDAYLKATGLSRVNIMGTNFLKIFSDNSHALETADIEKLKHAIERVIEQKKLCELTVLNYDFSPPKPQETDNSRHWRILNTPILDESNHLAFIIHRLEEITPSSSMQPSDHSANDRMQLLIDNVKNYAIIMLDENQCVLNWNKGAEQILGFLKEEILGHSLAVFLPSKFFKDEFKKALEFGYYEEEGWYDRKDASQFWAQIIVVPIYDQKNHLLGFGKIINDLTKRKDKDSEKNEFISIVNHELRTPLTSIFGAIRLLLNWASQSPQKNNELLDAANANCDRLMRLINDILDIEKLSVGGMTLNFQETELNALITHAITINSIYSKHFGINITATLLPFDAKVNIDPNRLIQVLTNLISNAIKFSEANGEVNVSLSKKGELVEIAVTNSGEGIPDAFKNKLFEKFSQADASNTRSKSGSGLGLAISKAIMAQFGRTIQYKSTPGGTTTFYFDLPLL